MARNPTPVAAANGGDLPLGIIQRVFFGALGGICAVVLKLVSQDKGLIGHYLVTFGSDESNQFFAAYAFLTVAMVFLGGVVGLCFAETNRGKMLMLGISAPALLGTYAGGEKVLTTAQPPAVGNPTTIGPAGLLDGFGLVAPAYAQGAAGSERDQAKNSFQIGIGAFPGMSADIRPTATVLPDIVPAPGAGDQHYWVVVGSHLDAAEAKAQAEAINAEAPDLGAFVGLQKPGNPYYPVIVGEYLPVTEATELLDEAKAVVVVEPDSYLSAYPDRLPGEDRAGAPRRE